MNCVYTRQQKTEHLKGEILGEFSSSETSYPGGNIVRNITEDVSYNQNNNFITSLLWGAKWTNLPDNKLTYCINFGSSVITSVGGVDIIEPTVATIASVDQCMTDLGEIINLTIEKTTNVNDAVLSFNFIDADGVSFLGLANPPVPTNDTFYNVEGNYASLLSSVWAAGNIYIGYKTTFNFQKGSYNYITIVHELGHAIVGIFSLHHANLVKICLNAWSPTSPGYTIFETAETDSSIYTKEKLTARLMVLLSGRIAEEVFFGASITSGASKDIEDAYSLAEQMIVKFGMGRKIVYPHHSEDSKNFIDKDIEGLIENAYNAAREIIISKQTLIEKCSNELIEKKILLPNSIFSKLSSK